MKICFVCSEYPPGPHGGIGTFVQVLARALVGAGHEVRVLGCYEKTYPAADYEEDQGVKIWRQRIPNYQFGWVQARFRLFTTLHRWGSEKSIDIISTPDYQGWAAAWPTLPVPVVVRLHGSSTYFALEMHQKPNRMAQWLERRALARADFWCSVSQYTADRTQDIFSLTKPCSAVLYNPVELPEQIQHDTRSQHKVVFTGTLAEKKGVIPLFQSWPAVLSKHPQAKLHIFGKDGRYSNGSMREFLSSLLSSTELQSVIFHGHKPRETIFQALATARVAVFPSYAEAFAIAPLEAMAWGCPTIYSQRGSGPELIRNGHDGLLINPDQPAMLFQAISSVLSDDQLAQGLGVNGRARIEQRFTLDEIIPQNEAFYRSCISKFHETRITSASKLPTAATY
jgi:glycogen synthase